MKLNNLTIEKNVRIPLSSSGPTMKGKSKYKVFLESMQVGDSVMLDFKTYGPRDRNSFQAGMYKYSKELGMNITTRMIMGEGFRVWRVQ